MLLWNDVPEAGGVGVPAYLGGRHGTPRPDPGSGSATLFVCPDAITE